MTQAHTDHMTGRHMQIGEAAERVGLSIRTIRHYDEAGLVVPSARSEGGFRLYTEPDLDRLQVIKKMKPLGFALDEMRDLLHLLDELAAGAVQADERVVLLDQLATYHDAAQARVQALREQLVTAEGFARQIQDHIALHRR